MPGRVREPGRPERRGEPRGSLPRPREETGAAGHSSRAGDTEGRRENVSYTVS